MVQGSLGRSIRYVDYKLASKAVPTNFKTVYRVEILRRAIDTRVSRPELEALKKDLRNGFLEKHLPDLTAKSNKQYRDHATKELASIVGTKIDQISIGQPSMLGLVDESDDWVSIALLAKVQFEAQGGQATAAVIFKLTTALVKGKMLTLIVMRTYENEDDLQGLLDSSRQWTREIGKLNLSHP